MVNAMKHILLLALFIFFNCALSQGQSTTFRPDPSKIEQVIQNGFSFDLVKSRLSANLNSDAVALMAHPGFEARIAKWHFTTKRILIKRYFEGSLSLLMFQSEIDQLISALIERINSDPASILTELNSFSAENNNSTVHSHAAHHTHNHSSVVEEGLHNESGEDTTAVQQQMRIPGGPCVNPDFESCNFNDWTLVTGQVNGSAPYSFVNPTTTTTFGTTNGMPATSGSEQHYITTGGTDTYGFPMVYPGGSCSAEIGDFTGYNYMAAQIRKTFLVSAGDAILTLHYAVVLEDGGHTANEQPYFRMRVYDQAGNSISCAAYEAYANDGQPGWQSSGIWRYKPWTTVFIPLAPYLGQNVTIEFTVGDCAQGGHAGYAYVDATCDAMAFNMSANAVCAGQPITINGPPGGASYLWSTGATTQSITTSTPGAYSVTVIPVTGSSCSITLDTVVNASPNPIANFTHNSPVCFGTAVQFTDQSNPNGATINSWSWNFGNGATSTLQNPTHTYAAAGTYNVQLTVSTTAGCTHSVTIPVTQAPDLTLPTSFVDENCGQCDGSAVVAPQGGTAPYSYNWGAAGGNVPALNSLCAGNYPVTVTDNMGCTETATVVVGSGGSLSITNVATTPATCPSTCNGTITVTAPGATQFSIDGGVTFQASNVFNNMCPGNYTVTASNSTGCNDTEPAVVTVPNPLTLTPGPGSTICIGQSATVSASASGGTAPYTFTWNQGLPSAQSHNVTPLISTDYQVSVSDNNGCNAGPLSITITVNPPLQVVVSPDVMICPGASATLTANASGGDGDPYNYSWTDGAGFSQTGSSITVSPTTNTTYIVTATDNCGTPQTTAQVNVGLNPVPQVTFVADNLSGCVPVAVNFTNTTDPALSGNCQWNFGNGQTSNNCNPSMVFNTPGCYDISLTVTSPAGCIGSLTIPGMICAHPYPVADFVFGPQPTDLLNTTITFINTSAGASTYSWDFAGLGSSTAPNTVFTFPDEDPGNYDVCLAVENAFGCQDTVCKVVVINDFFTIYVPNAFTPDNDGKNDIFFPVIDGFVDGTYQIYVFNRWGEIVFESNDPNGYWDGKYRGVNAKQDVYVWKIVIKDAASKKKRTYYGHVSLLR
ncbi:MAG TPA: hypothetical protein DEP18_03370 [Flavobacteriales bacterium]|nr:hypothetical protein [Flavobacteriales bacterium]